MADTTPLTPHEQAVLIAGGPVDWPRDRYVPDLEHVRARMPDRADLGAYCIHALRFFEDVLTYAEQLEAAAVVIPEEEKPEPVTDSDKARLWADSHYGDDS